MNKFDINRYNKHKKQVDKPVDFKGKDFVRYDRNQGNINVDYCAEETDTRK